MTEQNKTETDDSHTTEIPDINDNSTYILVFFKFSIPIIIIIACVTIAIYYIMRKRRLDQLRHRLVPFYKFEPGDGEDEWQTELLDESDNQKSITRLQDYKSTGSVTADNNHDEKSYF